MQFILILIYENNFLSATSEVNSSILNLETRNQEKEPHFFFYWNYTISIVLVPDSRTNQTKSEVCVTIVLKLRRDPTELPQTGYRRLRSVRTDFSGKVL